MKIWLLAAAAALAFSSAHADETKVFEIAIKDHKFDPATVEIPAGEKIKLLVKNQDKTPEEFESHDFNREKVIPGNSEASIFVGPLEKGEYKFFGEFHEDTAKGTLVVK